MAGFTDHPELHPETKPYSVIRMDEWKPPSHEDFAYKIQEISSLDELSDVPPPGTGESIIVLDEEGRNVEVVEGSRARTYTADEFTDEE